MTLLGITGVSAFQSDKVLNMSQGQWVELAGQRITLESLLPAHGQNYQSVEARFRVAGRTGERTLVSQRRFLSGESDTDDGCRHRCRCSRQHLCFR